MFTHVQALSMEVIPYFCLIDLGEYGYDESCSTTRSYWLTPTSLACLTTVRSIRFPN